MKIVITGASGFIGRASVQAALAAGHQPIVLSSAEWRLGAPLPTSCASADAILHLACCTLVAKDHFAAAAALDLHGTRILRDQARAWPNTRFLFVSSQSATATAHNAYGRSKYAIETLFDRPIETIIRPGLVYDNSEGSVFGLFAKLSKLPLLPVLSNKPCIQPIEVKELAAALIKIASVTPLAASYNLGSVAPLSFAATVAAVARRLKTRPPLGIPVPAAPIRLLARMIDQWLRPRSSLLERIDGLIALEPMETSSSLRALNVTLADF